ncbi:iron complex transport system permease protein [Rhodovulum sulfidophilum]|uniref:ABC transporter permease n=1 Tax=Rhodovulum sulfidophilum TaxID=35806 RepID=UPI0009BE519C|nr:iron chelate uptake ABC transporter family permease subunit [Rhodovulum sulfidophilum]MCW2304020.1 iron complex transport system permease protein [Rhodovulum sulfidophilum]
MPLSPAPPSLARRAALPAAFAALSLASLLIGAKDIGIGWIFDPSPEALLVLTASRLPRLIALVLTGMGLAISGVILQQILRNRFAEPATTGGMEAAKLGILVALTLFPAAAPLLRMGVAMLFCLAANLIFVAILQRIRFRDAVLVPVIGLMFGAVLGALAEFYAFSRNMLQSMQGWMLGDFSRIVQGHYEMIYLVLPVVALTYVFARRFTVLAMGQDMAESLGLGYRGMVALGLTLVSATVAATVITAGAVPFVGLVVPNLVTLWRGDNLRHTLPTVALSGGCLLLFCDILGRIVIYPYEVPLGLTVGAVGGAIFLLLILRRPA